MPENGLRYSKGKVRVDLIPAEAMEALAEHFTKGAEKYAERNWEKGMDWHECYNSLMRHALSWHKGEDLDKENGSHHMVAVMWNALALYIYHTRRIGKDTRPVYLSTPETKLNCPAEISAEDLKSISHWGFLQNGKS